MKYEKVDTFNWSNGSPVLGAGWKILKEKNFQGIDPTAKIITPTKELPELKVDIPKFTLNYNTPADHVKALITTEDTFQVANGFLVSAEISTQIHCTEINPYGADPDDPRLASGAIAIIDDSSGIVVNFEISNRRIITLREVYNVHTSKSERAMSMCDPHLLENFTIEPGSWHRYEISYYPAENDLKNQKPDKVKWFIDGDLVREVDWLPAAGPPPAPVVKPSRFTVNLAIFTLLDELSDGKGGVIRGYDPEYKNTTFGQGATVSWRNVKVGNL